MIRTKDFTYTREQKGTKSLAGRPSTNEGKLQTNIGTKKIQKIQNTRKPEHGQERMEQVLE
uniref:Uncharacterized protein n=1 Tax=Anguilla anguilla TaxID=7936 RepID=A0A0E9XBH1_ANGAN